MDAKGRTLGALVLQGSAAHLCGSEERRLDWLQEHCLQSSEHIQRKSEDTQVTLIGLTGLRWFRIYPSRAEIAEELKHIWNLSLEAADYINVEV